MTLNSQSPMVVFHREIMASEKNDRSTPVLVSQNFFRHNDRYYYEDNQQMDKYVTEEFLVHVIYGCRVVITNPTSSRQKLNVLTEIPGGAIPVLNGHYTRTVNMDLHGYSTRTIEYYFYFPRPGTYPHFPVHVSKNEESGITVFCHFSGRFLFIDQRFQPTQTAFLTICVVFCIIHVNQKRYLWICMVIFQDLLKTK